MDDGTVACVRHLSLFQVPSSTHLEPASTHDLHLRFHLTWIYIFRQSKTGSEPSRPRIWMQYHRDLQIRGTSAGYNGRLSQVWSRRTSTTDRVRVLRTGFRFPRYLILRSSRVRQTSPLGRYSGEPSNHLNLSHASEPRTSSLRHVEKVAAGQAIWKIGIGPCSLRASIIQTSSEVSAVPLTYLLSQRRRNRYTDCTTFHAG